jgi:hypothetical protein
MSNLRTYTDEQLRVAIAGASCWADVATALGKGRNYSTTHIQQVATRLGFDSSHFNYKRSSEVLPMVDHPFSNDPREGRHTQMTVALQWFLDRGYPVSIPIEPTFYDFVVESNEGFMRIQVKTTAYRQHGNGRYSAHITRKAYRVDAKPIPSLGKYIRVSYTADQIDYFFIITAESVNYLIPLSAVSGLTALVLDEKYAAFAV